MIAASQLSLSASSWSIVVSVLVVGLTATIGWVAWKQSGFSAVRGWQELFRTCIVALVALMLNQPEWIEQYQPDANPTVVVLWDDSVSMQTQDQRVDQGSQPITRAAAIESLKDPAQWTGPQGQNRQVVIQSIGDEGGQPGDRRRGTDLNRPLNNACSNFDQLLAVVLISDGDWNTGDPPADAASQLRLKKIPLHTVAVGSPTPLPDIDLVSIETPTFGIVAKPVRIPITIDSSLPRAQLASVTLQSSDGTSISRDLQIAAMGQTRETLEWTPDSIGDFTVTVTVPPQAAESIVANNSKSSPIAIRREKLRVLIVESYPRWEYRFLRNALSRDPGVDVACLLLHPGLPKVGGGSVDYIKVFPETIDELSEFDVVFLGDVGTGAGQLTNQQCERLKGLIEHQASGLVFIPGNRGHQFDLQDTALADLVPVILDTAQPGGWGARTPGHFELTARGRQSLLTRLADHDNSELWEDLPGFQWYAPVVRAKAGSDVLAVHREMTNQFGRLPLLVTRTFGTGKVLFMGTDGAWRWRKGVEDKYHYRFWGQVVRWMAYQRNMAEGETMRLIYSPDQPQIDQVVSLRAHVMDSSGEPLQHGDVAVMITSPSGKTDSIRLRSSGDDWGVFAGRFTPTEPGEHRANLACLQTSAQLDVSFHVHGDQREPIGKPARPDVLDELSRITGGSSVSLSEVDKISQSLAALPPPPPVTRRLQLWSHPLIAALLVLLLGLFWTWRKITGLV